MAIITLMITLSIYVLCSVVLQFLLASETARNNLGLALANCVVSGTETEALSREQLEKCRAKLEPEPTCDLSSVCSEQ